MKYLYLCLAAAVLLATTLPTNAQLPRTLSVQGLLTDNALIPVPDGIHTITIRLYDKPSGNSPALYEEEFITPVFKGLFNLTLGAATALPASVNFDKPYYIGVSYDDKSEMPRITLSTVPYAHIAQTVPDGSITPDKLSPALLSALKGEKTLANSFSSPSFIGGGDLNTISTTATYSAILAGKSNIISGAIIYGAIGGGYSNAVSANSATISGGYDNSNSGQYGAVGGGYINAVSAASATISGGYNNTNSGQYGAIGGGYSNVVSAASTTISGGYDNSSSGQYGAIGGGYSNAVSGNSGVIGGGYDNTNSGQYSAIGGGYSNNLSSHYGVINGGYNNAIYGVYSAVGGGYLNSISGSYASIPGGRNLALNGNFSFGFNGGQSMTIPSDSQNVALFANTNLWLANNDNTARELRFFEPQNTTGVFPTIGTNYTSFKAGAQNVNIIYTLPLTPPAGGEMLTSNAQGELSWGQSAASGAAGGDLTGSYPNPQIAAGVIVDADINSSAAIAYGKLNLTGSILDADIAAAAGIQYSKLSLTNSIANADITANAVTTSKVANGIVTTSKMADSAISGLKLLTSAVTTGHLNDNAVTTAKLAGNSVDGTKIALGSDATGDVMYYNGSDYVRLPIGSPSDVLTVGGGIPTWVAGTAPTGSAGGDLANTYPNPTINSSASTGNNIVAAINVGSTLIPYSRLNLTNSIANADITANAVTTSKVANGIVTTSKMADSAISGLKLLTSAVTTGHLNDNAVTTAKLAGNSVDGTKIALGSDATGDVMYYNGSDYVRLPIGSPSNVLTVSGGIPAWTAGTAPTGSAGGDLANTYPNPTINSSASTGNNIVAAINAGSTLIPYSRLNLTNSIANADITANAITTSKVANGIVTTSKMADSAISGLKLLTSAVTTGHLNNSAVTTAKLASNSVDGTKIALGSDATGDVMYYNGSDYVRLPIGSPSDVLTVSGGIPTWVAGTAPTGSAGGDLTNTYPNPTINSSASTGNNIVAAINAGSTLIPYARLNLSNSIINGDITANAVTTSKVANGTVITSKMADSAISGLKLLTSAVTTGHLNNSAVTTAKLASNSVDGTKIALGSDATGDVMYYNGSDYVRLPIGSPSDVLTVSGGIPAWTAPTTSGTPGVQTYAATADGTNNITITNLAAGFHILTFTGTTGTSTDVNWTLPDPSSYPSGTRIKFTIAAETAGGSAPTQTLSTPSGKIYNFVNGFGTTSFSLNSISLFELMTDGTNWYRI